MVCTHLVQLESSVYALVLSAVLMLLQQSPMLVACQAEHLGVVSALVAQGVHVDELHARV